MKLIDIFPILPPEVEILQNVQKCRIVEAVIQSEIQYLPIEQECLYEGKSEEIPMRFAREEVNFVAAVGGRVCVILPMRKEYV